MILSLALASTLAGSPAFAGVTISFGWKAPPPLVVVSPGVQVVEDSDEEIFFNDGFYWVERDGGWYHTRDWHGHWEVVEREHVPVFIATHERGHYRRWKHEEHQEHEIKELKHEVKEEKHEEKEKKHHGKH